MARCDIRVSRLSRRRPPARSSAPRQVDDERLACAAVEAGRRLVGVRRRHGAGDPPAAGAAGVGAGVGTGVGSGVGTGVGSGVGFGSFVGGGGASLGGTEGSSDGLAEGGADGLAGGQGSGAAAEPDGVGNANDGTTPSGPGVGTTKHEGEGLGAPHVPPTRTPQEAPYGWKPPL